MSELSLQALRLMIWRGAWKRWWRYFLPWWLEMIVHHNQNPLVIGIWRVEWERASCCCKHCVWWYDVVGGWKRQQQYCLPWWHDNGWWSCVVTRNHTWHHWYLSHQAGGRDCKMRQRLRCCKEWPWLRWYRQCGGKVGEVVRSILLDNSAWEFEN